MRRRRNKQGVQPHSPIHTNPSQTEMSGAFFEQWHTPARRTFLMLLIVILTAIPLFSAQADTNDPLYFVQITDTHFGRQWHHERLEKAITAINKLPMPVACVIHTGDVGADNMDQPEKVNAGFKILKKLKPPLHMLAGNHDILPKRPTSTLEASLKRIGPLCTKVDYHGVRFLLIYTEPLAGRINIPGYDPIKWLSSELQNAGNLPVIVCHHRPSINDFYNNRVQSGWPEPQQTQWREYLNSANVKAIIAGHFHRDELHWVGNIPVYVGQPIAAYWKRQASFRIYQYKDGKLSYRTQYIQD